MSESAQLAGMIERASRHLVWQTPLEKSAALGGLYEAMGDTTRPAGVLFHGLGLTRGRGGACVEAFCQLRNAAPARAQAAVAEHLGISRLRVILRSCSGFRSHAAALSDAGGHIDLVRAGGYGTIGGVGYDLHSPLRLAVSNNHVFAQCNAASLHDDLVTRRPFDTFGALFRYVPLLPQPSVNVLDGAVGWLLPETSVKGPTLRGSRDPAIGLRVKKTGARTGLTWGTITSVRATAVVSYTGFARLNFARCFKIVGDGGPFSRPGDSGSLVLDSGNAVVGLLFAGDEANGYSLANPSVFVTSELHISL